MVVFDVEPLPFYELDKFGENKFIVIKNKVGYTVTVDIYSGRVSNLDDTRVLVIDIIPTHDCKESAKE